MQTRKTLIHDKRSYCRCNQARHINRTARRQRLVEFQREGRSEHFSVGNIYLAKVRKLMPGLNACFVNVGYERDAFLHYLDLGTRYKTQEKFLQMLGDGRRNISLDKVAKQPEIEKREPYSLP